MHDLTETKSGNLATWATDINHHHQQACLRAGEAINHAIEAGKLLMRVKARLPHGEFGGWLGKNLEVTDRQARRYMAAAQGKPIPARAIASNRTPVSVLDTGKSDTVLHLPGPAPGTKEYAKELEEARSLTAHLQYAVLMAKVRWLPVEDRAAAYETIETVRDLEFQNQEVTRERDILMNENAEIKRALKRQRREIEALKKATH